MICELEDKIFRMQPAEFETLALETFRFQYAVNPVYRAFTQALNIDHRGVDSVARIPFLPVSFFKTHDVVSGTFEPQRVFESSGTTATGNSRHLLKSEKLYRDSFLEGFKKFYGEPADWCVIGLLPSYLERQNSSLVMMVNDLIELCGHPAAGFYLYNHRQLAAVLQENERLGQKTLLIGVTFALLDFAAEFRAPLKYTTVMETGGMKGRRKEITREEVHEELKSAWSLAQIHSEYGMTELLSQAYSSGDGLFRCPPWMRIVLRDEDDPLTVKGLPASNSETGLVNVIDLANIYSCSFIAIDDIGRLYPDSSFEILGRMDSADMRGCSLMYHSAEGRN